MTPEDQPPGTVGQECEERVGGPARLWGRLCMDRQMDGRTTAQSIPQGVVGVSFNL